MVSWPVPAGVSNPTVLTVGDVTGDYNPWPGGAEPGEYEVIATPYSESDGGGIFNSNSALLVRGGTTIATNDAGLRGGAISNSGTLTLD